MHEISIFVAISGLRGQIQISLPVPLILVFNRLSFRHDWYQTESQVIVTVMVKNVPKDGVHVSFMEKEV